VLVFVSFLFIYLYYCIHIGLLFLEGISRFLGVLFVLFFCGFLSIIWHLGAQAYNEMSAPDRYESTCVSTSTGT